MEILKGDIMATCLQNWRKIRGISEPKAKVVRTREWPPPPESTRPTPKATPTFLEALHEVAGKYGEALIKETAPKNGFETHELTGEQIYTITFRTPPKYKV